MRLTVEQIKSITVGAIRIEEQTDGIHFYKCTQKQIDAYALRDPVLGQRASGTTGVRLDFHTNSKSFTFCPASGRKFELHIDGLIAEEYKTESMQVITRKLTDSLGKELGEYRVTLVFPSHDDGGVISYIELDDGAYIRPHKFDRKFLFIGDSITQGWETTCDSYSYAYRVSNFFNAESVIQGIGGGYFHETFFDKIDFDPDVVFVALGTNDFGYYKTYDEFRAHCEAHLSKIAEEYKGKKLFDISPIWRGHRDGKAMGTFEACRQIVEESAAKYGFTQIDGLKLVPPVEALFADGYLHPNDNGFSHYAENLIKELVGRV